MYQRRSNLQNLMILLLDCLTIVVSLILANYIRNGRLFESDDARMDFGLLLGAVLVVFLAMNLFGSLYRNMMLRGPLHECMCVIRNNAISFVGLMVPHLFRLVIGPDMKKILPLSAVGGAALLLFADTMGRILGSPGELESGIVTALIGAPVFILIIRKAKVKSL